jgi:hypothetical protein
MPRQRLPARWRIDFQGPSFDMMIVPDAANMPPTPWQTEILAPGIWAGAMPRIWHAEFVSKPILVCLSCVSASRTGRPLVSTKACILLVSPPRDVQWTVFGSG